MQYTDSKASMCHSTCPLFACWPFCVAVDFCNQLNSRAGIIRNEKTVLSLSPEPRGAEPGGAVLDHHQSCGEFIKLMAWGGGDCHVGLAKPHMRTDTSGNKERQRAVTQRLSLLSVGGTKRGGKGKKKHSEATHQQRCTTRIAAWAAWARARAREPGPPTNAVDGRTDPRRRRHWLVPPVSGRTTNPHRVRPMRLTIQESFFLKFTYVFKVPVFVVNWFLASIGIHPQLSVLVSGSNDPHGHVLFSWFFSSS